MSFIFYLRAEGSRKRKIRHLTYLRISYDDIARTVAYF